MSELAVNVPNVDISLEGSNTDLGAFGFKISISSGGGGAEEEGWTGQLILFYICSLNKFKTK